MIFSRIYSLYAGQAHRWYIDTLRSDCLIDFMNLNSRLLSHKTLRVEADIGVKIKFNETQSYDTNYLSLLNTSNYSC